MLKQLILKGNVGIISLKDRFMNNRRGQNTVEYIVGSAIVVLLLFALYKLFKDKKVFESVLEWFKDTFKAKAK